jgi:hypothetical protein
MGKRNYWLDLFTGETRMEFKKAGGTVSGHRQSRWKIVQQIKKGDHLLCHVTGISRFIGILEVVSEPFRDTCPIWSDEEFPCKLEFGAIIELPFDAAVPVHDLKDGLSFFQKLKNSNSGTGAFRGSPARWSTAEGGAVVYAFQEVEDNPIE